MQLRSCRTALIALAPLIALLLGSCGSGGGSGSGPAAAVGEEETKPGGGGTFFVDPHKNGGASRVRLVEMFWARLVDVHDLDASGQPSSEPVFRNFAINENIQSDAINYDLEINPITQATRLVIRRRKGAPAVNGQTFGSLLALATDSLPPVAPKHDNGTSPAPFSFVARNACLVLRFDDLLKSTPDAEQSLPETVEVLTGYPPRTPFNARMLFDPNHGGLAGGRFHSTRVLIDMTVSEAESSGSATSMPVNSVGLPSSLVSSQQPNVSVRIPTRLDFGGGQFELLTNLVGAPLATSANGPVDTATGEVVRAMRAGNRESLNNGFMLDLNPPEVVGGWPITITGAQQDPDGETGLSFILDARFENVCRTPPTAGSIFSVGTRFLEVVRDTGPLSPSGVATGVRARALAVDPIGNPNVLLGNGLFLTTFDPGLSVEVGCWVNFSPEPDVLPSSEVKTDVQVVIRFSEPMNPGSVGPFGAFLMIRGDKGVPPDSSSVVVGEVIASSDLREFIHTPLLPLAHTQGLLDSYHLDISGPTDLAGNQLANELPAIDFTIDPDEATQRNGGFALRFESADELAPIGADDLRGQFFFDFGRGVIQPREVTFQSFPVDRNNPVPSIMIPFPPGVQTPLSPFGSRLMTVWRYVDMAWSIRDETKLNLDVAGLSWSPVGGKVNADFYEEFEIRLAHSRFLPDEDLDAFLLPRFTGSGLNGRGDLFTSNVLNDPLSPQKTVHPRAKGYVVDPADVFKATSGTTMMPFPMNRDGTALQTFTWRDTAALDTAGPRGTGIPLAVEAGAPLFLETPGSAGSIARAGQVPTIGLPLLLEYRCYPSDSGVGLNAFDISLAINSSALPAFRTYSTGGINQNGTAVFVNPDLETTPNGGFNPSSSPPGNRTARANENAFYLGQLDTVVRVSRVHTVWMDTLFSSPTYAGPVLTPEAGLQPEGTRVEVHLRGATGFDFTAQPFDATRLDPYGEPVDGQTTYVNDDPTWHTDPAALTGGRYAQMRLTFVNNIETGLNAEASGLGIAYFE